ncbi:hypothetical protein LTR16_006862, partial [Cryomyces antarcticus]
MTLLAITPAIVAAVQKHRELLAQHADLPRLPSEPSLEQATVGDPVSHLQLIQLSKALRDHTHNENSPQMPSHTLDTLLRSSRIYTAPPAPKKEPLIDPLHSQTAEYKALMARLRHDEEALAYTRMLAPAAPYPTSTLTQRHPITPNAHLTPLPLSSTDDESTYADINRQTTLILNVLVSILACAVAIWVAARHWPVPARLALSMGGSALVAVAEVVVYGGYIRRVGEAKGAERERERRE